MWFKLFYSFLISWVKDLKITPEQFKGVIFLMFCSLVAFVVVANSRLSMIEEKLNEVPGLIESGNKLIRDDIKGYYNDGKKIFDDYAYQNSEDMQMIIDYADKTIENAELLKKLIRKSADKIIQEMDRQELDNKLDQDHNPTRPKPSIDYRKLNYNYDMLIRPPVWNQPNSPAFTLFCSKN